MLKATAPVALVSRLHLSTFAPGLRAVTVNGVSGLFVSTLRRYVPSDLVMTSSPSTVSTLGSTSPSSVGTATGVPEGLVDGEAADEPSVTAGFVDCAASAGIVKGAEAAEGVPVPAEFEATTVKVYVLEGASEAIEQPVDELEQVRPPGLAVAVYPVIAAPPFDEGADHVSVAVVSAPTATRPVGAPGAMILVRVVTCSEFEKFIPWSIAQTLIVYVVPALSSRRSTA